MIESSPHTTFSNSVSRMMMLVIAGLIPGYIAWIWFFGWGVVINSFLCVVTAVLSEAWILRLRKRPVLLTLVDGSAIVTGLLIALALPPVISWWLPVLATAFAMIVAKHLYGGLGYNPFNPAMVGYAVLLIAFPKQMTAWLPVAGEQGYAISFQDNLAFNFSGVLPQGGKLDLITQASPLDVMNVQTGLGKTVTDIEHSFTQFSGLFGIGWDWISLMFLVGGCFLLFMRVISWQIPVAILASLAACAGIGWLADPATNPDPVFHLLGGATMLGAFFIATDPVTASTTPRGRLIYGTGIGFIIYMIRTFGGYQDGVAFGVLLMNMAAPTIDYYTQPRAFGHQSKSKSEGSGS
jgi:electron transport complex protein RnfD